MDHGAFRGYRLQTVVAPEVHYKLEDGTTAYVGPGSSVTFSVFERWCENCSNWITVRGVIGSLRFMADHDSGDCACRP